jgi:acyl-CoA thioester hydrolase
MDDLLLMANFPLATNSNSHGNYSSTETTDWAYQYSHQRHPQSPGYRIRNTQYNIPMSNYRFYYPLQVRYGDLDPQWHVNHAHTVTLIEQGRFAYLHAAGLFDGHTFSELGLIVADVHIAYLAPIAPNQPIRVGVRVSRIGNKSLIFENEIEDVTTGQTLIRAETVMVAFDYHTQTSMPVSQDWRQKIAAFEGWEQKDNQ